MIKSKIPGVLVIAGAALVALTFAGCPLFFIGEDDGGGIEGDSVIEVSYYSGGDQMLADGDNFSVAVGAGTIAQRTITIGNTGDGTLDITDVTLTGDVGSDTDDWEFYFDPALDLPMAIDPGNTQDLILKIRNDYPGDGGTFNYYADIAIMSDSTGGLEQFDISVSATLYY